MAAPTRLHRCTPAPDVWWGSNLQCRTHIPTRYHNCSYELTFCMFYSNTSDTIVCVGVSNDSIRSVSAREEFLFLVAPQTFCMTVSVAYFAYDFICCFFIEFDMVGNVHHVATMAGLLVGLYEGRVRTAHLRRRRAADVRAGPSANVLDAG